MASPPDSDAAWPVCPVCSIATSPGTSHSCTSPLTGAGSGFYYCTACHGSYRVGDQCYCATAKKLPTTAPRKPFPEKLDAVDLTQEQAQALTHYAASSMPVKSGRIIYTGGMHRDSADEKVDWSLVFDGPLLARYAAHLTKGARHYSPRNWMKAAGPEEAARFRESAARHFAQWMAGDTSEDHAAAVVFNLNGHAYVEERLRGA